MMMDAISISHEVYHVAYLVFGARVVSCAYSWELEVSFCLLLLGFLMLLLNT